MRVTIKAKNMEITGELQEFVYEKIASLKKFIDILKEDEPEKGRTLAEITVEIERETKHHKKGDIFRAETQVSLPGRQVVAEAKSDDLLRAIIESRNELKAEIKRYKLKKIDKNRREQRKSKKEIAV